ARQKRIRKNLDLICANDVSISNQGFNSDKNALHLFWQDGDKVLNIATENIIACGDGANDLPMLEHAGTGIAWKAKPVVREKIHH
ncbi:HAD hydrolase family protein, partial [Salmonella enterica subsp. enterica serovar Kentucky]|nr:HAD hydrolase family protein [Salmonella enterica subsp. enterica serovar Kentucky]